MAKAPTAPAVRNRYEAITEKIFQRHHEKGATQFSFNRDEMEAVAKQLKIVLPKNIGDLIYSFRYRTHLPATIGNTAAKGSEWIIEAAGRAKYQFKQVKINRIVPRPELITIKVPDATPEIVVGYAQGDEQALLAKSAIQPPGRYFPWPHDVLAAEPFTYDSQKHRPDRNR